MGEGDNNLSGYQSFADFVREKMAGRSHRAVALKAGISPTTVGNYLLGRLPDLNDSDQIARLAIAFDSTRQELEGIIRAEKDGRAMETAERTLVREPEDLIRRYVRSCRGVIDREHMEASIRKILDEELRESQQE